MRINSYLSSDVAKGVFFVGSPSCDYGGHQSSQKASAIKEHVKRVGDKTERVGPDAITQFNKGERQIQDEEEEQVARILVSEDESNPSFQLLVDLSWGGLRRVLVR